MAEQQEYVGMGNCQNAAAELTDQHTFFSHPEMCILIYVHCAPSPILERFKYGVGGVKQQYIVQHAISLQCRESFRWSQGCTVEETG